MAEYQRPSLTDELTEEAYRENFKIDYRHQRKRMYVNFLGTLLSGGGFVIGGMGAMTPLMKYYFEIPMMFEGADITSRVGVLGLITLVASSVGLIKSAIDMGDASMQIRDLRIRELRKSE